MNDETKRVVIDPFTGLPTIQTVKKTVIEQYGGGGGSGGGGGPTITSTDELAEGTTNLYSQWEPQSSLYNYLVPKTKSKHLLIGDIDAAGLALLEAAGAPRAVFVDDTTSGTSYFINHSAGDAPFPLGSFFVSARSKGTANAPTALASGNFLGGLVTAPFGGTGYDFSGSAHLIPGVLSAVTGTVAPGVVERKVFIGSLIYQMISWDSNDNAIKLNEAQLDADITMYWDNGTALAIDGATGLISIPVGARIADRVQTAADATSITPTGDDADLVIQTNTQAAGTLTINAPTGTPTDGQRLRVRIKTTNAQTFAWNATYRGSTDLSLPTTIDASKTSYYGFEWNATDTFWDLVAMNRGF